MEQDRTVVIDPSRESPVPGIALEEMKVGRDEKTQRGAVIATLGGAARSHLEVVECVDARHPVLSGRVRVQRPGRRGEPAFWIPTLYRLPVREGDRLLVAHAENWDEPVGVGVIDGFARRPEPAAADVAVLELKADECLRVRAENGTELLELGLTDSGPVVKLLTPDVNVELSGSFNLQADSIHLRSRRGAVELESPVDIVVKGEVIRLN